MYLLQGALEALPKLPLDNERKTLRQAVGATNLKGVASARACTSY
jgi:hypothetical protein